MAYPIFSHNWIFTTLKRHPCDQLTPMDKR